MKVLKYALLALMWPLGSCQDQEPALIEPVVVDGVMYLGQPLQNLRLWNLSPLDAETFDPLEADAVVIRAGETDYFLSPQNGAPGIYFDAGGLLELVPDVAYQLIVVKGQELIFSVTVMPQPPQSLAVSQDQFTVSAADRQGDGFIGVSWVNTQNHLMVGKLILISDPLNKIDPSSEENSSTELVLDITSESAYAIPFNQINYYGNYAFILYGINEEYRQFFGSSASNTRVQQYTNVFNGLGIFTAAAPDTVFFEVTQP